ncbi:MAG: lysophospholipid acyltransferase family protein [Candidatus Zixiibacteriota bacterium]
MLNIIIHALGRLFISVFIGVSSAPKLTDKQCIIAANHNSHVDIMVLFRLFPLTKINKVKTIAAKDYFSKGLLGFMARSVFNSILVDRRASARETMDMFTKEIEAGYSLIIFPEGTRGKPGVIKEFKSGIGKLALDFPDLPIYPVYLSGAEKTLPRGAQVPVPFNITINVLPPVYGREYAGDNPKESRDKITAEIEARIRSLTAD